MLGFSVYLSNIKTDYIKKMLSNGFNTIFTSLQIPEEHHSNAFEQFKELKRIVGDKATVIVDINPSL